MTTVTITRRSASRPLVRVRCAEVPAVLPDDVLARWLRALPRSRRSRLTRRLARGAGLDSLTAVALLASLRQACGLPPLSRLRWTRLGKPYFPGGPSISLTHSRGFAACAVAPPGVALGIDLEPAARVRTAVVRFVASDAERSALIYGQLTPTGLWTAKEAVLKAAGAGLPEIAKVAVRRRRARFGGVDYGWRHHQPRAGWLLAIATRGRSPRVDLDWSHAQAIFAAKA